jgi:hypothetical protein
MKMSRKIKRFVLEMREQVSGRNEKNNKNRFKAAVIFKIMEETEFIFLKSQETCGLCLFFKRNQEYCDNHRLVLPCAAKIKKHKSIALGL